MADDFRLDFHKEDRRSWEKLAAFLRNREFLFALFINSVILIFGIYCKGECALAFAHYATEKPTGKAGKKSMQELYTNPIAQFQRYKELLGEFEKAFGTGRTVSFFSSPGRCEIIGNHTDHQQGHVVTAALSLDMIAAASPNGSRSVRFFSEGYSAALVDLDDLAPRPKELGTPAALIRGIATAFTRFGFFPAGFDAYISSQLPSGAGLSSSAAFECLIGTVFNAFFCHNVASPIQIAQAGRFAELEYFGKPCGLMDQLACAVGGFVSIDLEDPASPLVEPICFLPEQYDLCLFLVNTGGSHEDLTAQYAAIPAEMQAVAASFGKQTLRQVSPEQFWSQLADLRGQVPDRALVRAIHFFEEDRRAAELTCALAKGQIAQAMQLLTDSGCSSQQLLQNAWPDANPQERGLSLALALSKHILQGQGACRIHGGGFAGSILALLPEALETVYQREMEAVFGPGVCRRLTVRPVGAAEILL